MANRATTRERTLQHRLDILRDQWRTATTHGDHTHAAAIEAAARRVLAERDQPEPEPDPGPVAHGWWLVTNAPVHPGCAACRRAPGGPDHHD